MVDSGGAGWQGADVSQGVVRAVRAGEGSNCSGWLGMTKDGPAMRCSPINSEQLPPRASRLSADSLALTIRSPGKRIRNESSLGRLGPFNSLRIHSEQSRDVIRNWSTPLAKIKSPDRTPGNLAFPCHFHSFPLFHYSIWAGGRGPNPEERAAGWANNHDRERRREKGRG